MRKVDKVARSKNNGVTGGIQINKRDLGRDEGFSSDFIQWECLTESLREGNWSQDREGIIRKPDQMSQAR